MHDKKALAMPRGSGKTRVCQAAILWAVLYGYHRFAMLIGAVAPQGTDAIAWFKKQFAENKLLQEDFPRICYPLHLLDNEPRRCLGQRYHGKKTNIRWGKDRIVLPTIPASPASGSVIEATSLEGHVRGAWASLPDGSVVRPTLAMCDDPQTPEALALDTPIATPDGFVAMDDICVGDIVYGDDGSPQMVTATSDVMCGHACYRVTFDDGTSIVADAGHKWMTSTQLQRTNARRRKVADPPTFRHPKPTASIVTTEQIAATLLAEGGRNNHSIPLCGPVQFPTAELPVPPYTLGAWLGDGHCGCGRITTMDEDIERAVADDGFKVGVRTMNDRGTAWTFTAFGLSRDLRRLGVLKNKHVPRQYLFTSVDQRIELLRGLMDTDGSVSVGKRGVKGIRCKFSNTNRALIDGVLHLCRSMGIKARVCDQSPNHLWAAQGWDVHFITTLPVFKLQRKMRRLPASTKLTVNRRYVTSVERVDSVPVRCIAIDSPSHLYLCGHAMVPTHNSARSQGPAGQTSYRLQIINQDVQGLAGPDQQTAILVPCTVIQPGDLADQLLNRNLYPDYRGERTKRLYSWPTNKKLWEEYREIREQAMRADEPLDESIEFYRARRCTEGRRMDEPGECSGCQHKEKCMDCGAVVDWAERLDDPRNLSAVQAAMHSFYKYGPAGFAAEFQNEPLINDGIGQRLTADLCASRVTGRPLREVPVGATEITCFIDVQQWSLWYATVAWAQNFTGQVIDYGIWPEQSRQVVTKAEIEASMNSLTTLYPGRGVEGTIQAGLSDLVSRLLSLNFQKSGGGLMRIGRLLVDAGTWPQVIHAVKMSKGGAVMFPSRGMGLKAGSPPMASRKRKPGEKWDMLGHWYVPTVDGTREFPHVLMDVNWWKSFLHAGFLTAPGDPGAITLFGDDPAQHATFAAHQVAENYVTPISPRGVPVDEWSLRPGRPDNEWFDCMVGNCVAASMQGCRRGAATSNAPVRIIQRPAPRWEKKLEVAR